MIVDISGYISKIYDAINQTMWFFMFLILITYTTLLILAYLEFRELRSS
jgi:hypothetical protein